MVKENNVEIDPAVDLKQNQAPTQETTEETAATPPQETPADGVGQAGDQTAGQAADQAADPAGAQTGDQTEVQADAVRAEIEALHRKIAELERENEEYLQSYRRLRADFDNYRRRTRQELSQAADNGKEELLVQILPVLDNLERALTASGEPDTWRSGVEMIFRQFLEILYKTGLKPIPAVGEMFDPNLHEALLREPSEQPENTILEEIKKGYLFGDKTIRPSLVKVAAAPESADGNEKE